ncbi:MAG: quinone-dependent dihydroorotate dehydrogenase [Bdellovibrionales bacterium]|nr:quinone-dependent dihydroorotate dehydrogenase [Bdellovibrionales bacterium]
MKKPWLSLPAGIAYKLSHPLLKLIGLAKSPRTFTWRPFTWRGLQFANPLGISGGLDKNAEYLNAWWALGAGFVEIGTVTPLAQTPNPGKIIARDNKHHAVWNKMGFPNEGVAAVKSRLKQIKRPYHTPLFINIGKNRQTENKNASQDYLHCIRELKPYADAFIVNVSSPNTAGLRDLLTPENLANLLKPLISECAGKVPLLLKLSPDMTDSDFSSALVSSLELGIDGWILTNTTLARDIDLNFSKEGGVSGRPLAARSKELLKLAVQTLGDKRHGKLLISVGGVMTAKDVFERLNLGAQLVQIYSALIFEGPTFFCQVAEEAE